MIAVSVALSSATASAQAGDASPRCKAAILELLGDDVFSSHPAGSPASAPRPARPDVRSATAHLYRTVIRQEAKKGPNFAGHFTLVGIGCGAATVCPAFVDATTGKVFFPPQLRIVSAMLVDTGDVDVETLNYRKNSNLLAVFGTPNDDMKEEGLSYYIWRSDRLSRTRFIPRARLCGAEHR